MEVKFGRGLTGMHGRVCALGGTFEVLRESGRSTVGCRLAVAGSDKEKRIQVAPTGAGAGS